MGDQHTIVQIYDDHKPENFSHPTTSNSTSSSNLNTKKKVTMDLDLYKATIDGNVDHFKNLSPSSVLDQTTPLGNSFLHVAATFGRENQVEFIASRYPGLIAARNIKGDTPLHAAVQSCNTAAIEALMQSVEKSPQRASVAEGGVASSNLDYWSPDKLLELKNMQGNTALHEAMTRMVDAPDGDDHEKPKLVMEEIFGVVKKYLEIYGVEVLFVPNNEGESPFYLAVEYKKKDLVELMLEICEKKGYTGEDIKGKSPVNAAIRGRNKGEIMSP